MLLHISIVKICDSCKFGDTEKIHAIAHIIDPSKEVCLCGIIIDLHDDKITCINQDESSPTMFLPKGSEIDQGLSCIQLSTEGSDLVKMEGFLDLTFPTIH